MLSGDMAMVVPKAAVVCYVLALPEARNMQNMLLIYHVCMHGCLCACTCM